MKKFMLSVFLLGCGASADAPSNLSRATVNGRLTSIDSPSTAAPIRVALVWESEAAYILNSTNDAEDVEVSASFPSNFTLSIDQAPPSEVLFDGIAHGILVVYQDMNDNGKLDLLPYNAPEQVDIVLSDSMSDASGSGFTLEWEAQASNGQPAGFYWQTQDQTGNLEYLPTSTPLSLALTGDPSLRSDACNPDPNYANEFTTAPDNDPDLVGATITCNADGSFDSHKCYTDTGCTYAHCDDAHWNYAGEPPPASQNWPCPIPQGS